MIDKTKTPWDTWRSWLSPSAAACIAGRSARLDEEQDNYGRYRSSLSAAAREKVDALVDQSEADVDPGSQPRFGVVECPDGDPPRVKLFRRQGELAKHIAALEGQDVYAWVFHGTLLRITQGPQRWLVMPDGETLLSVPLPGAEPVTALLEQMPQVLPQDDGFLGAPELAETFGISAGVKKVKLKPKPPDEEGAAAE